MKYRGRRLEVRRSVATEGLVSHCLRPPRGAVIISTSGDLLRWSGLASGRGGAGRLGCLWLALTGARPAPDKADKAAMGVPIPFCQLKRTPLRTVATTAVSLGSRLGGCEPLRALKACPGESRGNASPYTARRGPAQVANDL